MFLKFILLSILGYFVFKTVRQFFLGLSNEPKVKENNKADKDENFQQKNQSNIEDADFEEIE
jgi:hypothetical protein